MKPVKFKEANTEFAKNQPQYNPLPAFAAGDENGTVVFCMKGTFLERIIFLITGKMWVSLLTFNRGLTPSYHTVKKSEVLAYEKDVKRIWYKEKTFHFAVIALLVLITLFEIGISIYDGEVYKPLLWAYLFPLVFVPFMTWVFRNNP